MNLKRATGIGHGVEHALKPLDVGSLLDGVNEALIPDSSARTRFRHLLSLQRFALGPASGEWPEPGPALPVLAL